MTMGRNMSPLLKAVLPTKSQIEEDGTKRTPYFFVSFHWQPLLPVDLFGIGVLCRQETETWNSSGTSDLLIC